MTSYDVYIIDFVGTPRNHQAFFVHFGPGGGGTLYQVRGAIETSGMYFEKRGNFATPSTSPSYLSSQYIGSLPADRVDEFEEVCRSVPPPAKQFDRRGPIPGMRRRRCQEWVQEVYDELMASGILE
jgi:hypothetical protein